MITFSGRTRSSVNWRETLQLLCYLVIEPVFIIITIVILKSECFTVIPPPSHSVGGESSASTGTEGLP